MPSIIPELVHKAAEKAIAHLCLEPISRSGQEFYISFESVVDGFELRALPAGQNRLHALARVKFSLELEQWTLHRPRGDDRWSYVPEAGGALDLNKLLRYVKEDPLNIFWK